MIKNFEEVTSQLAQLASIINSFQSEAVQIRIVELILGGGAVADVEDHDTPAGERAAAASARRPRARKKRRASPPGSEDPLPKPRASSGRPSAGATLDRLLTDGFFAEPRAIGDIVTHCATSLALQYKQSDFSPALVRAVRDKKLTRAKNEGGQFVYEQP
jgi:hypothetical protein